MENHKSGTASFVKETNVEKGQTKPARLDKKKIPKEDSFDYTNIFLWSHH